MDLRSTTRTLKLDNIAQKKVAGWVALAMIFSFILPPHEAWARASGSSSSVGAGLFSKEVSSPVLSGISEFFYRNDRDDILVPVFVLGAVTKPGLYHVPMKSDLITLLAVSGGTTPEADLESISVKNQQTNEVQDLDLADVVSSKRTSDLLLKGNEVVFVKPKVPMVSNNTAMLISVVAGVMSIALSAVIIRRETR